MVLTLINNKFLLQKQRKKSKNKIAKCENKTRLKIEIDIQCLAFHKSKIFALIKSSDCHKISRSS